jgi:hypothetical protein
MTAILVIAILLQHLLVNIVHLLVLLRRIQVDFAEMEKRMREKNVMMETMITMMPVQTIVLRMKRQKIRCLYVVKRMVM